VFFFAECFLTLGKVFAECPKKALGKEIFAECSLSSVTLGKAFAEYKIAFAECLRHSAKNAIPVVTVHSLVCFVFNFITMLIIMLPVSVVLELVLHIYAGSPLLIARLFQYDDCSLNFSCGACLPARMTVQLFFFLYCLAIAMHEPDGASVRATANRHREERTVWHAWHINVHVQSTDDGRDRPGAAARRWNGSLDQGKWQHRGGWAFIRLSVLPSVTRRLLSPPPSRDAATTTNWLQRCATQKYHGLIATPRSI
jgi:hypothetical protein